MKKIIRHWANTILFTAAVSGCTSYTIEDCGNAIGNPGSARIRSSDVRMQLANPPAAAERFFPYAAMSALAYEGSDKCTDEKSERDYGELRAVLAPQWTRVPAIELADPCGDDKGLAYQVWERHENNNHDVVIAFRGTVPGLRSWIYGNLWGITHLFTSDTQYSRARKYTHSVIAYFNAHVEDGIHVKFYSTGHSLGGGLAQDVFYDRPKDFVQSFAFAPSSVTSFTELPETSHLEACDCEEATLDHEARIYRIYEAYEILGNIRFPHKLFFYPQRYIQEVRFSFPSSWNEVSRHSMKTLAFELIKLAKTASPAGDAPWYAGLGEGKNHMSCTELFVEKQSRSCAQPAQRSHQCPL
jgi:hypothetical protein